MSKHEIRMRRQRLTAHGSERFRNYGAILERHEQVQRIKKILRVFTYFFVILIIVMLIVIVVRIERKATLKPGTTTISNSAHKLASNSEHQIPNCKEIPRPKAQIPKGAFFGP